MPYQLTIVEKPTYLHAIVTGDNTAATVAGYLQELQRECESRQCFNLLIEENLKGRRLETWDVYQIASESSAQARGRAVMGRHATGGAGSLAHHRRRDRERARFQDAEAFGPGAGFGAVRAQQSACGDEAFTRQRRCAQRAQVR